MSEDAMNVIVGGQPFLAALVEDIKQAKEKVWIQCMSFEADKVGQLIVDVLCKLPQNVDRRILIDSYSKVVVNDIIVPLPAGWINKNNAKKERQALDPLIQQAKMQGIKISFTNPLGWFGWKYPARNHKKMMLIDDKVSYLGGINLSEHNILWHDLMVRHKNEALSIALGRSFIDDWEGRKSDSFVERIEDLGVVKNLNRNTSMPHYRQLMDRISKAHKIRVVSPYITNPFLRAVIHVDDHLIIRPSQNNKPLAKWLQNLNFGKQPKYHAFRKGMLHMKFMLIDDREVIYGSSNFDMISIFFEDEILMHSSNPALVHSFQQILKTLTA